MWKSTYNNMHNLNNDSTDYTQCIEIVMVFGKIFFL